MVADLIQDLKLKYSGAALNEADTRFKIFDVIIHDVLKWPRDVISCEVITNGVRADYVLKGKAAKPILIIESKKAGKYFDLPRNINSTKSFQKIAVDKLLSDRHLKDAILQVKEYCEDLGCSHAVSVPKSGASLK